MPRLIWTLKGVAYTEATANTNDEVIAAASSLIADGVDAVFTPTDNIIMPPSWPSMRTSSPPASPLHRGRLLRAQRRLCHLRRQLHRPGCRNGRSAYQAMTGGMDGLEDYYQVAGGLITVNSETAAALAIDPAVFESLGQVTTVTTTED